MFKSLLNNENFLNGAFVENQKVYAIFNTPASLTSSHITPILFCNHPRRHDGSFSPFGLLHYSRFVT